MSLSFDELEALPKYSVIRSWDGSLLVKTFDTDIGVWWEEVGTDEPMSFRSHQLTEDWTLVACPLPDDAAEVADLLETPAGMLDGPTGIEKMAAKRRAAAILRGGA